MRKLKCDDLFSESTKLIERAKKRMQDEPVVRMAEIEIDPLHVEAYRRLLVEEIEASVSHEDGVLALNAVAIKGSPEKIRILEIYAGQAAYEAHLRTPHFLKYKAAVEGMVTSLALVDVDPVVMRSKP